MAYLSKEVTGLLVAVMSAAMSGLVLFVIGSALDPTRRQDRISETKRKHLARRLGRPIPPLNAYEEVIAADIVNPYEIHVDFDSVGGLEDVKEELEDLVVLPLQRPELFVGRLLRPQKGVLLYGPPGTGKTLLAKALAKEADAVFINVKISTLMSKWFGEAQRLVSAVFTLANKLQPAIIFVDEVDSFLGERGGSSEHEAMASMKTEFMTQWDGFGTNEHARVMVLCATNRPWALDEAILRRTSRVFEVPLPNLSGRTSILRKLLQTEDVDPNIDVEMIAEKCQGLSGADINELCRQAALIPVKDLMKAERKQAEERRRRRENEETDVTGMQPVAILSKRPIQHEDFLTILSTFKASKHAAKDYRNNMQQSASPYMSSTGDNNPISESGLDNTSSDLVKFLFLNWVRSQTATESTA